MHQLDIKVLNTSSYVYGMEYVCYKASLFLLLELCFSLLSISLCIFLLCLLPIFITGTLFFVVIHSFMDISIMSAFNFYYWYFVFRCYPFLYGYFCLLPIFITGTLFFVVIHFFMDISTMSASNFYYWYFVFRCYPFLYVYFYYVCFQFLLLVLYFSLLSIFYGYFYYDCFQFLLLVLCFSLLSMFYCVCFYVFTKGATKIAANIPRVKFWSAVAEFWDYCCWYSIIFFYKFMLCESLYCLFKLH